MQLCVHTKCLQFTYLLNTLQPRSHYRSGKLYYLIVLSINHTTHQSDQFILADFFFLSLLEKFKGSSLSCANRHFVVVGNHFKTVGRAYLMWCSSIIMGKPKKVSRVFFTKIICRFSADVFLTNMKRDNFKNMTCS